MTPYHQDPWLTVYQGDCREVMRQMEPESVHCVVTSPPYWGLRDYGVAGALGLEATPEEFVANMVDVFREVKRVLRSDGTCWVNLGDSYHGAGTFNGWNGSTPEPQRTIGQRAKSVDAGLKPKDLVGIPWRVAFALQQPYYAGKIKDERDRTWLAALMDGEGTFTILATNSASGSMSYPPIAQVRMTSPSVVGKAGSLVGVMSPAQYPPSAKYNRAVYQWRLSGRRAADVARELYPYLLEKRKQALIAWNHQEVRDGYETKRGVFMPAEARAKQIVCRDLIRRLNHGEHVDLPSWMVEPPPMTEPGWYLRSDVIWAKPNPMPESVTDRPTKSHEYLFLLTKSPRYYYDADAVREPQTPGSIERWSGAPYSAGSKIDSREAMDRAEAGHRMPAKILEAGRNLRTVWTIATAPYPGAHFATFPPKLVEPCIKAGAPEKVCGECGAGWRRVTETEYVKGAATGFIGRRDDSGSNGWDGTQLPRLDKHVRTLGFIPSCKHDAPTVPATVLDPFAGSGTVGMVAQSLSRRAVLIDLNGDYLVQAMSRNQQSPLGLETA